MSTRNRAVARWFITETGNQAANWLYLIGSICFVVGTLVNMLRR
jgi:hypothetical protein